LDVDKEKINNITNSNAIIEFQQHSEKKICELLVKKIDNDTGVVF